jgi:hypothetical protein
MAIPHVYGTGVICDDRQMTIVIVLKYRPLVVRYNTKNYNPNRIEIGIWCSVIYSFLIVARLLGHLPTIKFIKPDKC